jgi:NAD(P)-dependent dehydrogenase (short-subunit alcohol dehydrogenase family)
MAGLLRLFRDQLHPPPDPKDATFEGRTILVTGANVGLGFEAALKFLNQGVSSLIIGSRSLERGQRAKEDLERRTGRTGVIQIWHLDMNSFTSVLEFADRVNRELVRLDVALLNAGVLHRTYVLSPEGWEETLQVNVLSTALLAVSLLPKLRESSPQSPAHLILVSSGQLTRVSEKDLPTEGTLLEYLNHPRTPPVSKRYGISKLLVEYVARNLAELTRNTDGSLQVIVNTVKPGYCVSSLGRQFNRWYERLAVRIFSGIFARPTEVGSRVLVSAALQGAESHGKIWKGDGYME